MYVSLCMYAFMQSFYDYFVNNTFGILPEHAMVKCNRCHSFKVGHSQNETLAT